MILGWFGAGFQGPPSPPVPVRIVITISVLIMRQQGSSSSSPRLQGYMRAVTGADVREG